MRPLRYSINVKLDGCCDHREGVPDEELHRHATENLAQADALLFGRVTYELMEAAFRPAWTGEMPDWMEPFRRTIDAAKKYVVSSTLDRVDWNAELVRGDLGRAVQLKQALAQNCAKNTAGGVERVDASEPRAAGQPRLIALRNRRTCAPAGKLPDFHSCRTYLSLSGAGR
jgi:hypothetical protein